MSTTPLKAGDEVTLLHERINPINGMRLDRKIVRAGEAFFKVQGCPTMLYWYDRGKVWASEKLDLLDATRTQFSNAATGPGETP
jgi:hypothetical protein